MATKCPNCLFDNTSDSKFCKECGTQLLIAVDVQSSVTKTLETPVEQLATGSTLAGRYQIIEELGKGGMGTIYKVYDSEIERKCSFEASQT